MSHLPITLAAYFFNALAVLIDKFLLTKHVPDPLVYIFYFSAFSMVALLLLPFTPMPTFYALALASFSTILWTTGAYYMFKGLQRGQASRVIPIIGSLIPIFLLLYYGIVSPELISSNEVWAAGILTTGLIFLILPSLKGKFSWKEVVYEVVSGVLFAASYIVLHQAYDQGPFLTIFAWSRVILIPVGITMLLIPVTRKRIFGQHGPKINLFSKVGALFLIGQAFGGTAELLLTFSISLANPALVNSLQGAQYAVLFIFSLILSKKYPQVFDEKYTFKAIASKTFGIVLIGFGLFLLAVFGSSSKKESTPIQLGVTFAPQYAESLGLDPKETYIRMLDELQVKQVRLPIYWELAEAQRDQYNFEETKFYVEEAQKRNVSVILGLGLKQPRWPECYIPSWANNISAAEREAELIQLIEKEVTAFQTYPNITIWQVENEPFLYFGLCEKPNANTYPLLKREVAAVKALDNRPVLVTDSGELASWVKPFLAGDIFGSTVYRTVSNNYFGLMDYPFPPMFYGVKRAVIGFLTGRPNKPAIVAELQAEPWSTKGRHIVDIPTYEQMEQFAPQELQENVTFAQQSGLDGALLWGVEWWYWMESQGHPEYINEAKDLFSHE